MDTIEISDPLENIPENILGNLSPYLFLYSLIHFQEIIQFHFLYTIILFIMDDIKVFDPFTLKILLPKFVNE